MEMFYEITEILIREKHTYIRNKNISKEVWIKHVLIVINKITATFHNPRQRHPPLLIILKIYGKEHRSWSSLLCNCPQYPITFPALSRDFFHIIPFSINHYTKFHTLIEVRVQLDNLLITTVNSVFVRTGCSVLIGAVVGVRIHRGEHVSKSMTL